MQDKKGHDGGDATAAFKDMLGLVNFQSDAYKLTSLGWEILEPCSEAEVQEVGKEVEAFLVDYQEPTDAFILTFNEQDKQVSLPHLFEKQYLNKEQHFGNLSDEFPLGEFTVKLKSDLSCLETETPLMIRFATKGHDPFFPLLPSIWTPSNSSRYQLESVLVAGTGHATVFHRDKDGTFVCFDDGAVSRFSEKEAKKIFDNHAVSGFYKKLL